MGKISIVNLSNYTSPIIEEYYGQNYITYGRNNDYFQYLIDRVRGSATNGAVINSIIDLIYGNGLTSDDKDINPIQFKEAVNIFKDEDVRRAVSDIKMLGQCAFQIQYKGGHSKIASAKHIPIEKLAIRKADKKGKINGFYYSDDWTGYRSDEDLKYIPAFGTSKEGIEILYIKPYRAGLFYFSNVDYQGGLQYAELEEEIGNYHINNIKNGLAPSMLINMNNGVPSSEEKMKKIESEIKKRFSGSSNSGKFILAFNDDNSQESSITPVALSDASEQYQFLSTESAQKILTAHRVISPLLLGLPSATGFGSNAEELATSYTLMIYWVAKPFRDIMINEMSKVLRFNDNPIELYFADNNPFTTEDVGGVAKLSSDKEEDEFALLDFLAEDAPDGFEEFIIEDVLDEPDDMDYEGLYNNLALSDSAPTKKSIDDSVMYKVRYRYKKVHTDLGNSRKFCQRIHKISGQKQYFRKEDIHFMSFKGVNKSHGHKGLNYSIWLYKGGVNCKDIWERVIFKKKLQDDGTPFVGNALQNTEIVKRGYGLPDYPRLVKTAPIDMPGNGHHPAWIAEHLI